MTQREALEKMAKYCAYQERCQFEVRQKLFGTGFSEEETNNIICDLIEQNFIDEERFAKTFTRGKFRQKKWGRLKIKQHLKQKQISEYCINKGLQEITTKEYHEKLELVISKKSSNLIEENEFIKKQKVAKYALSRGFESNLIWEILGD